VETLKRKPFQGVVQIIQFNWHFYALAVILFASILLAAKYSSTYSIELIVLACIGVVPLLTSLAVSFYVYDASELYDFSSLEIFSRVNVIYNIHAGFDETSAILSHKFPQAKLYVFDFYNPEQHTEVSIQRARKKYPPYPGTIAISSVSAEFTQDYADLIAVIFSAHEIRKDDERALFFQRLRLQLTPEGKIVVIEHIRDFNNTWAYSIGVLHFLTNRDWLNTFEHAGLRIVHRQHLNPFVQQFILEPNDRTPL
jgi:uncharacterized membrane protein (DUF485 family)